ncbi:MAG: sulfotransferase [Gammaproteobacteria bacterium]|nr:sulfotransferase [Gammaproteobacteria bacterium]
MTTIVYILSDKSTGSSVLQRELLKAPGLHTVPYTRHRENETLFWNTAAAVLGMPQATMYMSELPFSRARACEDLQAFLSWNLDGYSLPADVSRSSIFDAWQRLSRKYGPLFLDKSPHHLHCRSSLDLMLEFERDTGIESRFIGLVRNPMDALYSSWRRWNALPERAQHDWRRAYTNLRELAGRVGDRLYVVRYEDLVTDPAVMAGICRFLGIEPVVGASSLHRVSLGKWRSDATYGFVLDPAVAELARSFGYAAEDLQGRPRLVWPVARRVQAITNGIRAKQFRQWVKRQLRHVR